MHLNRYHLLAYVSQDNVFDVSDVLVDDASFEQDPLNDPVLHAGQFTDDTSADLTIPNYNEYSFLVLVVKSISGQDYEQNYLNNVYIVPLPAAGAALSEKSLLASQTYKVERQEGAVNLENISGNNQSTSYILYSVTGEKVCEGSFEQITQINTIGLKNGIYVVKLTDGTTSESVKILIQD